MYLCIFSVKRKISLMNSLNELNSIMNSLNELNSKIHRNVENKLVFVLQFAMAKHKFSGCKMRLHNIYCVWLLTHVPNLIFGASRIKFDQSERECAFHFGVVGSEMHFYCYTLKSPTSH